MINRNFKDDSRDSRANFDRMPAFQLNKFQSEFNLSFNKEMANIIASALERNEEVIQNSGKNVPTCLFALLSKLEDFRKPRNYDNNHDDYDQNNRHNETEGSYEYR